jgi:hypothetical protein
MSESTIQIPLAVQDKGAIAELKKIQKALGDVGKESATVNKAIAAGMEANAKKVGAAYTDISEKIKKASNVWGEFNSKLEAFNKIANWGHKALELSKFSEEFKRLERAVPVERMRALEKEAGGTVTKFELLKKAAKEMNLSATAGMDETSLKLRRTLTDWENFFDGAKAALGGLISAVILGLDRISDEILGLQRLGLLNPSASGIGGVTGASKVTERIKARRAATKALPMQGHEKLLSIAKKSWANEVNISEDDIADWEKWNKNRKGDGGGGSRPTLEETRQYGKVYEWDRDIYGTDSWAGYVDPDTAPTVGQFGARMGVGTGLAGWGIGKGFANTFAGFGAAGSAVGGLGQDVAGAMPSEEAVKRIQEQIAAAEKLQQTFTEITGPVIQGFAQGLGAAFDAIITGSDGAAKAFAKASAAALKSLAVESAVRAVYHGAMALGSLAFQDYKGAGMHGASAAKFAATALLAGAGAAGLASASGGWDTGGAGGGGGASASSYAPVSGGQRDTGPTHVTVNVYGNLLPGSEARLGAEIEKATETARRSGRITDSANVTRFS